MLQIHGSSKKTTPHLWEEAARSAAPRSFRRPWPWPHRGAKAPRDA